MDNTRHFEDLIPLALRSVPYIFQSHLCKAYIALENLYAQKPHLPDSVWEHCVDIVRNDEPKVDGLIAVELLKIQSIVDRTAGRDFGPDWIISRGLMPLSYWAMRTKYRELGFEGLFESYAEKALNHPTDLGHELSLLSGYWHFYQHVLKAPRPTDDLDVELFIQRFTEFVIVTFAGYKEPEGEPLQVDNVPSRSELVGEALTYPGFFGHNVIAVVWAQRISSVLRPMQSRRMMHNLSLLTRPAPDSSAKTLSPLQSTWTGEELDSELTQFFLDGPENIHQITLADALLWVWGNHPEHQALCAANLVCFTQGTRPQ